MAAARLDAALWELHRPLQEAPDGAEPTFAVAPARLVKEVEECLNVENVETTLARARLFRNEHPPDLCRWLALSKSFKILETPRTTVLKEMAKYIKKKGAGPHTLTAFESLRLVLEGRGHATARQAAASALRELFKRDKDRVVSGEQWRSLSHKCVDSLAGEKAKGVKGESMKLAATLIAAERPAPALAIDDRTSSPWDEQGASLLRICKLDLQKDIGKDSGSVIAALEHLCANDQWASSAAEIAAPAILTLLGKYAVPFQKVFTRYETPAKALRFLRRRASLLAPSLPSEPMPTYAPLHFAATVHPDMKDGPPKLVAKHASIALFETLHALAQRQQGDWRPVFALLEAGCRDVNPKVRAASLRSIAAAAPASSIHFQRLMEASNACADACDAQDNERRDKDLALQGEKDKVRRRLEHWDALQVRSAALHASSALVSNHSSDRPRASLQALAQRARRCIGAHADQCALYGENPRARQYLVDGLASLVKACSSLKGGRASLRVVCRDAVQVASIQHKRPDEDYANDSA